MPFTPVESSVGGILIGASVAAHMYFIGRVTGISGMIGGFYDGLVKGVHNVKDWSLRAAYLAGLVSGGVVLSIILPQVFTGYYKPNVDQYTQIATLVRFAIAGIFVGVGTYLGSGCTSGHMICGMSRLSTRSIAATMTFCGVAFALIKLLGTAKLTNDYIFGKDTVMPFISYPSSSTLQILSVLLAAVLVIYALLFTFASTLKSKPNSDTIVCFINGFVFALGLGISGMTLPSKVVGFFDIGGANFDPSLVCVALFAILPNLILFQLYFSNASKSNEPAISSKWELPTATAIDRNLILGACLFGVGWGLAGVCPGPSVVNLVDFRLEMIVFYMFYALGLFAVKR